ncbi:MAG: hypothetical protein IJ642_06365 [Oscillospiraceae bacterium]|nr:hypothetical protein [Oscillospiraceae bacterium]
MSKSIYSLVLSDEVVEKADALAYQMHTSRSNIINQLLAERLSCVTPEMKMQSVFSGMESLKETFRMLEQTSAHILSMQSQLNYKYKPTVQYSVDLFRIPQDGQAGKLRIQLRTQNQALLLSLEDFFRLWVLLEQNYLNTNAEYQISPGKLERSVSNPAENEAEFGRMLSAYVQRFDKYLRAWFSGISPETLERAFQQEAEIIQKSV